MYTIYWASMEYPWNLALRNLMLTKDGLDLLIQTVWYNLFDNKDKKVLKHVKYILITSKNHFLIISLLCTAIGQLSVPYSTVRPTKI